MKKKQAIVSVLLTLFILITDQWIKVAVKTGMYMYERIHVTDWFYILFTENRGMAFGLELMDKYLLTSFRIFAVGFLVWFIARHIRRGIEWGFLICLVSILAGAAGNIIDCLFYGLIFNNPPAPMVAEFVPWGTGYETFMQGRVVDMFYFPLVEWDWPSWIPFIGGNHFVFFSPIFNFADACISCGVIALLLFYHKKFQGGDFIGLPFCCYVCFPDVNRLNLQEFFLNPRWLRFLWIIIWHKGWQKIMTMKQKSVICIYRRFSVNIGLQKNSLINP